MTKRDTTFEDIECDIIMSLYARKRAEFKNHKARIFLHTKSLNYGVDGDFVLTRSKNYSIFEYNLKVDLLEKEYYEKISELNRKAALDIAQIREDEKIYNQKKNKK